MISLAVDSWLDFALQNVALSLGMIWLEWSFTKRQLLLESKGHGKASGHVLIWGSQGSS